MLRIGQRVYQKNDSPGVYEVPLTELEDLQVGDIPPHSSVEVVGLPTPSDNYEYSISATNGGDAGETEFLTIWGYVGFSASDVGDVNKKRERIRRIYLPLVERGDLPDPLVTPSRSFKLSGGAGFTLNFENSPQVNVREAIRPFLRIFERLHLPEARVFVCHASEDKPSAREFANRLSALGAEVWLDEWEIRVGDSIVEKINAGIRSIKPFGSSSLRQLGEQSLGKTRAFLSNAPACIFIGDNSSYTARQLFNPNPFV